MLIGMRSNQTIHKLLWYKKVSCRKCWDSALDYICADQFWTDQFPRLGCPRIGNLFPVLRPIGRKWNLRFWWWSILKQFRKLDHLYRAISVGFLQAKSYVPRKNWIDNNIQARDWLIMKKKNFAMLWNTDIVLMGSPIASVDLTIDIGVSLIDESCTQSSKHKHRSSKLLVLAVKCIRNISFWYGNDIGHTY